MNVTRRSALLTALGTTAAVSLISAPTALAAPSPDLIAGYTPTDRPAVFYSPHADDECISMGIDIGNHLAAGRNVLLILMTQGASPTMISLLNGDIRDNLYGLTHNPVNEGYAAGRLNTESAGDARWLEFQASARAMNRTSGKLRVVTADYAEGISVAEARSVMEYINIRLPGASHKTMTYTDPSADHNVCGRALLEARQQGSITDARWYVSRVRLQNTRDAGVRFREEFAIDANVYASTQLAARSYQAWSPPTGLYAFGYHSIPEQINAAITDPRCYVHA